jgi:hypothetical protein
MTLHYRHLWQVQIPCTDSSHIWPLGCTWEVWQEVARQWLHLKSGNEDGNALWPSPVITYTHPTVLISVSGLDQIQFAFCWEMSGVIYCRDIIRNASYWYILNLLMVLFIKHLFEILIYKYSFWSNRFWNKNVFSNAVCMNFSFSLW